MKPFLNNEVILEKSEDIKTLTIILRIEFFKIIKTIS